MPAPSVKPRGVYLTGSVSLSNADSVFRAISAKLPNRVRRIPDGETGAYRYYTFAIASRLKEAKGLIVKQFDEATATSPLPIFSLAPGVSARSVEFDNLGIADAAIESFELFEQLQRRGVLAADAKFLMGMMSPMGIVSSLLKFDFDGFEPAVEAAMKREIERAAAAIPHDKLAIQVDVIAGVYAFEAQNGGGGNVATGSSALFPGRNPKEEVLTRLVRYSSWVPKDVELGYHLCFGDVSDPSVMKKGRVALGLQDAAPSTDESKTHSGAALSVKPRQEAIRDGQPKTAASMVEIANELTKRLGRPYQFIHMPFPSHRATMEFLLPFRELVLPPGAELFLGLVNWQEGIEGARERIALAQKVVPAFGISTPCGMGRIGGGVERQEALLDVLAELSEPYN